MARSIRILHTADSHIGAELPARPRHSRPRRGDDFVASFCRVLARATELNVDLVIHAGDLFNRSKPHTAAINAATRPLLEVASAGIPVVIVPGNHERSTIPSSVLLAHPDIHVASEPATFDIRTAGGRIAVAAVPCIRRDSAGAFAEALGATSWHTRHADATILACHQTFESARCGPANYRFRSGENVVEREIPAGIDYVAAGHVHRYQVLECKAGDGPPIVYCGSCDRISFAERDEPKGCVLVEIDGNGLRHSFIEHDVRPMRVVPIDVTGLSGKGVRDRIAEAIESLPVNVIAAIRLSGRASNGSLRGLQLAGLVRELRPEALLTVSARAVEVGGQGTAGPRRGGRWSVFSALPVPPEPIAEATVDDLSPISVTSGAYAIYDKDGRLLYVGKSNTVRARIRSHLRAGGASHFDGWAALASRVEARPAQSELEALLIEAELIRRFRPPFNRQMRAWTHYCYIRESAAAHAQLEVCNQPCGAGRVYGPYRKRFMAEAIIESAACLFGLARCPAETPDLAAPLLPFMQESLACQRFFDGMCTAPCAQRIGKADYAERVRRRDALLTGADDSSIAALEQDIAASADHPMAQHAIVLRAAFERGALLCKAERLLDAPIPLAGGLIATIHRTGLVIRQGAADRHIDQQRPGMRLSKAAADMLCIATRHMQAAGPGTPQPAGAQVKQT